MDKTAWILWSCLLAVSLCPSAAGAAGAAEPAPFKEVDRILAQSGLLVAQTEAAVAGTNPQLGPQDAAGCRKDFSFDTLVRGIAKPLPDGTTPSPRSELIAEIGWHHRCLAIAKNDVTQCRALKSFAEDEALVDWAYKNCTIFYQEMNLNRALIARAPDAARLCVQYVNSNSEKIINADKTAAFCGAMAQYTKDAVQSCAKITPLMSANPESCLMTVRSINGQMDCNKLPSSLKAVCVEYAFYRKALTAGNAELCGDHPFCRVFMGGGVQSCQAYIERAKEKYCAMTPAQKKTLFATSDLRAGDVLAKEATLHSMLNQAHIGLLQLEPVALRIGLPMIQEIDARAEEIAKLRTRYARIKAKLAPPTPPAPQTPKKG